MEVCGKCFCRRKRQASQSERTKTMLFVSENECITGRDTERGLVSWGAM